MKAYFDKLPLARKALPFSVLIEQSGSVCPWCSQKSAATVKVLENFGRILPDCIEQIKNATDIVALVGARVELKRSSANFVGLCPFHSEKSPSFNVIPTKHLFHCFGCKTSGGVIDFLVKLDGLEFIEAVKRLAQSSGVVLRYENEVERVFFRCSNEGCESRTLDNSGRLDELDYLMRQLGLKKSEALLNYLKSSGVLKEERLSPSIMPGQQSRKRKITSLSEDGALQPLPMAKKPTPDDEQAFGDIKTPDEPTAEEISAAVSGENKPEAGEDLSRSVESAPAAGSLLDVGGQMSEVGEQKPPAVPCTSKSGDVVCGKDAAWKHPNFPDGAFCEGCKVTAESFFPNNWLLLAAVVDSVVSKISNDDELEGARLAVKRLKTKIGTAKAFGKETGREDVLLRQAEEAIALYEAQKKEQAAVKKAAQPKSKSEFDGREALADFFGKLTLVQSDEKQIFDKRGLTSVTQAALRFRSNLKVNREFLMSLEANFPWEESQRSGLWLAAKRGKDRRPNTQFCGLGQVAKKPKHLRKNKDDKWVWGFPNDGWCAACEVLHRDSVKDACEKCDTKLMFGSPILIPYFDAKGQLIKLRPHKGGALSTTAAGSQHIYVPRASAASGIKNSESYEVVVITEGEFKAAALWQTVGDGAGSTYMTSPYGVCALPGITFGKNFEMREELAGWLRVVGCRRVIIAFDDEEKSDPTLESYQPDKRKRYDSVIWARVLANDLAKELRIRGDVVPAFPKEWRNSKGKADWDGALVKLTKETTA